MSFIAWRFESSLRHQAVRILFGLFESFSVSNLGPVLGGVLFGIFLLISAGGIYY